MPAPQFKKTVYEDTFYRMTIYAGAVKLDSKRDPGKRWRWRIALKPPRDITTSGELFKVSKLIVRAQAGIFDQLINLVPVQEWLFDTVVQYVEESMQAQEGEEN